MAVVNSDVLQLTLAGIKTDFDDAYQESAPKAKWPMIASEIETTLPTQNYAWLGRGATMGLFKDRVEAQSLNSYSYSLSDNIYKADMVVERKTLEDDQYALVKMRAQQLGDEYPRFEDELIFSMLEAGFTNLCYDGQYFFDVDHSDSALSGIQSNVSNAPLSDPALEAAHTAMGLWLDDKGKPMNVVPDTLVVGPKLERRAWNLVKSDVVVTRVGDGTAGTGATASTPYGNFFNGRYNIVVSPYITGFHWFLTCTSRRIKPLLLQKRSDVPMTMETDMDQPSAKIKEEYQFTVRAREVPGYGLWQLAYGSNATS